eukprot:gene11521-17736_t
MGKGKRQRELKASPVAMPKRKKSAWDRASTGSLGSSGSFKSSTSRCSIGSVSSASALAQHDAKLREAFRRGDVHFLANLLGPKDALDCVRVLMQGTDKFAAVTRDEVKTTADTNWPDEAYAIMRIYDSIALRTKLDTFFANRLADSANLEKMLAICGGEMPHEGDKGLVILHAEACRRSDTDMLMQLSKHFGHFAYSPAEASATFTARCRLTLDYFMSRNERKSICAFSHDFFESHKDELDR